MKEKILVSPWKIADKGTKVKKGTVKIIGIDGDVGFKIPKDVIKAFKLELGDVPVCTLVKRGKKRLIAIQFLKRDFALPIIPL